MLREIFVGNEGAGRGGVFVFKATGERMVNIDSSSLLECIRDGRLGVGEMSHSGKNPNGNLSGMSCEERLGMTSRQINSRGGGCA